MNLLLLGILIVLNGNSLEMCGRILEGTIVARELLEYVTRMSRVPLSPYQNKTWRVLLRGRFASYWVRVVPRQ